LKLGINIYLILLIVCCSEICFSQVELADAFQNLPGFSSPVFITNSSDSTDRIFVIEQTGIIKVFPNRPDVTPAEVEIFLDYSDSIASGGEMGLLGLAFHPDYKNNGFFYVNYTRNSPRRTIISRFRVSFTQPDSADINSKLELLTFLQPYSNHNGGWISFGPNDGYLYIASGDGGSAGDPQNNGQRINTMLGKILRIDVNNQDPGLNYAIPPTNPFYDSTGNVKREIYAWGLRNPWRCSFDPVTGFLWAGDVGQSAREEIDLIENGGNFGWRCYEGNLQYNTSGCLDSSNYIFPVFNYPRTEGYSVTGGYVYRGSNQPGLFGKYIYGDYGSDKIWSLEYDGVNPPINNLIVTATGSPTSFGVDESGELYICTFGGGRIYKFIDFSPNTFQLTVEVDDGWNLVSIPGDHPNGNTWDNWWPYRDTSANIFQYTGSYEVADTLIPGEGYWMKHIGARTYNTGDEWPAGGILTVPNNPISANAGWNLVGGYENIVSVGSITTTPPGLITSSIYGYVDHTYSIADDIVPGYAYWVKMDAAGNINLGTLLDNQD
jgi:glucose/arabinose dehydrogenase